jgi:hypothetical protein
MQAIGDTLSGHCLESTAAGGAAAQPAPCHIIVAPGNETSNS